jgi:hypothetical protein
MLFLVMLGAFATAGSAWAAFQGLPSDNSQVNDDAAAGIDKTQSVSGQDPTNADVVGGALTAGGVAVPWAIFRQQTTGNDQIFVRAFAGGAWATKGTGTVSGKSSASPIFSGSLNFDQAQDGEAPAIDFAGTGRTVPWTTWYESTPAFVAEQIFASRFDNAQGKWIFAGQSRGVGVGTVPVPSLNINTNQNAENPSVAGGSAVDPTKPGPWVTWQEIGASAPGAGKQQIFVEKPIGPSAANCTGVKPAAADGNAAPIGGFCWQQVGVERLGPDPSLNVDRTRDGIEPDIAFTGANDSVPWVVWYENGPTGTTGLGALRSNELVFAAKGVAPGTPTGTVDGGVNWIAVGSTGQGVLDATAVSGGPCGASATAEGQCSLNHDAAQDAEDPRVAAGTMNPVNATVPWVVWDETVSGTRQIFVARLVAGTHFELANGGAPISTGTTDATRADITFSGNTPYVSWRESVGGVDRAFTGHFVNAASPTFVLDGSAVQLTPIAQADVRQPISSSCIATPFNGDGAACQGGAIGTPFFLFTNGTSTRSLFAQAYDVDVPTTGAPANVTATTATLVGAVNPEGGPARASFQFGTTTAYGQTTAPLSIAPANVAVPFLAQLAALPPSTTLHYRAVASTDFGVKFGPDHTLTTAATTTTPPPPVKDTKPPTVRLRILTTRLGKLIRAGKFRITVTVDEAASVRLSPSIKLKIRRKLRVVGLGPTITARFTSAGSKVLTMSLSRNGKAILRTLRKAKITVTIRATDTAGNTSTRKISATFRRR